MGRELAWFARPRSLGILAPEHLRHPCIGGCVCRRFLMCSDNESKCARNRERDCAENDSQLCRPRNAEEN